jgi:transglutaminase-like putative cysteine protease
MKLKVEHLTQFEYDAPVYETATEVRLQPATHHEGPQECESFSLEIDPPAHIYGYTDYFGNQVHHFTLLQSHNKLSIVSTAVVNTGDGSTPASESVLINLYEYEAESRYAVFSPVAILYSARFPVEEAATDPAGLAEKVCRTINQEFRYEKGVTTVNSTVADVLEIKRGVCQDFAHVMITICRCLGLPTRYVSGYLYGGESDEDQEGASHAWCEVYCGPEKGWVGFDPTHASLLVNERYIKIGTGRDYADVTPVRGTYRGNAHENLKVSVRVTSVN